MSGAEVHAVSRAPHHSEQDSLRWWQGDVADHMFVTNVMSAIRPEIVIHLSACVTGRRDLEVVLPALRDNLMSTVNLLTAAVNNGCNRVVLVGSLEEPDSDQGQVIPCSPYAASKWSASAYGRMFHQLYKLPVVIARLFMTYGPAQPDVQKLIPYVILSLLQETPPKLGNGSRPVDWIYVDDAVEGLLAISQARGIEGQTIDVGSGVLVPVRTIVERLADLIGTRTQPLFGALPDRAYEQIRVADVADANAKLGWRATTPLEEGLSRTVAWYREQIFMSKSPDNQKEIL